MEKRTTFCNYTKFGPRGDGLGHTKGVQRGSAGGGWGQRGQQGRGTDSCTANPSHAPWGVEVGEDGEDGAGAAARRTLAARHGRGKGRERGKGGRDGDERQAREGYWGGGWWPPSSRQPLARTLAPAVAPCPRRRGRARESEHEREEGKRSFVKEKPKLSIYLSGWIPTRSGRSEKEAEQKLEKVRWSRRISFR